MKIASSRVAVGATHTVRAVESRKESLLAWVGERPRVDEQDRPAAPAGISTASVLRGDRKPAAPASTDRAAPRGVEAAVGDAGAGGGEHDAETDRRFLDLVILVRSLGGDAETARRLARGARDIEEAQSVRPLDLPKPSAPAAASAPRAGWGLEYELHAEKQEIETTHFEAAGTVTTAEGRVLSVAARLDLQHVEQSRTDVSVRAGDARKVDPLVLSFDGAPPSFSGRQTFDLDGDGRAEEMARLAGGSAYLALDRNGNGRVDDGSELFGPRSGDGFGELRELDADSNGWIDEADPAFARLRLWQPGAGGSGGADDGGGALGPQASLGDRNVGAIYLGTAATPFTVRAGGQAQAAITETGVFLTEDGGAGIIQHLDLVV